MAAAATVPDTHPHIPVLLEPLLAACDPVSGTWIDGTLGAGGYTRGLLDAGANTVIGIDRDPSVFELARDWAKGLEDRIEFVEGTFGMLDELAGRPVDGIVLDLGVSSMQLDQADRGFSFMSDGPLDMRMGQDGTSAADLVNEAPEEQLADVIFHYGEDRAARRIARAIVARRNAAPFSRTSELAEVVTSVLPRPKPGQSHPATRTFQAIRIAVNDEFGELVRGLEAAERILVPGGALAVVSFHSLEDRIVKRFMAARSDTGGGGNRYAPERPDAMAAFEKPMRAVSANEEELARNPRARSARLRVARRTGAPAGQSDPKALGVPMFPSNKRRRR